MSNKNGKPVWFITGCSTGFGRELASTRSKPKCRYHEMNGTDDDTPHLRQPHRLHNLELLSSSVYVRQSDQLIESLWRARYRSQKTLDVA
jgi:hypothetical protein